jgi:hypothetical protein
MVYATCISNNPLPMIERQYCDLCNLYMGTHMVNKPKADGVLRICSDCSRRKVDLKSRVCHSCGASYEVEQWNDTKRKQCDTCEAWDNVKPVDLLDAFGITEATNNLCRTAGLKTL